MTIRNAEIAIVHAAAGEAITVEHADITHCSTTAISVYAGASLTIAASNFSFNSHDVRNNVGGALTVNGSNSHVHVLFTSFMYNRGDGGAINVGDGASVVVESCVLSSNNATDSGGAVKVTSIGTPTLLEIWSSTLENNFVHDVGGAIYSRGATSVKLYQVELVGNHAGDGGAIFAYGHSITSLKSVTVKHNTADDTCAGLIITHNAHADIDKCNVVDNEAGMWGQGNGGGVCVTDESTANISGSSISSNIGKPDGGGVYVSKSTAMIYATIINKNAGGGVLADNSSHVTADKHSKISDNHPYDTRGPVDYMWYVYQRKRKTSLYVNMS